MHDKSCFFTCYKGHCEIHMQLFRGKSATMHWMNQNYWDNCKQIDMLTGIAYA